MTRNKGNNGDRVHVNLSVNRGCALHFKGQCTKNIIDLFTKTRDEI